MNTKLSLRCVLTGCFCMSFGNMNTAIHPKIVGFFEWVLLIRFGTEEDSKELLEYYGIIPSAAPCPPCPVCGSVTAVKVEVRMTIGWTWRCSKRNTEKCNGSVSPTTNTFLFRSKLTALEVVCILISFVLKAGVNEAYENMKALRKMENKKEISERVVANYYSFCRKVTAVIASHHSKQLGGKVKMSLPERIDRFLRDVSKVYPGPMLQGLELKEMTDPPTVTSGNIVDLIKPPQKKKKVESQENEDHRDISYQDDEEADPDLVEYGL